MELNIRLDDKLAIVTGAARSIGQVIAQTIASVGAILALHFAKKFGIAVNKRIKKISDDVLEKLTKYSWPGNIRELQNVIEQMVNIAKGDIITLDLLPQEITLKNYNHKSINEATNSKNGVREMILSMMQSHIPKTIIAGTLGISRSTLYRRLKEMQNS